MFFDCVLAEKSSKYEKHLQKCIFRILKKFQDFAHLDWRQLFDTNLFRFSIKKRWVHVDLRVFHRYWLFQQAELNSCNDTQTPSSGKIIKSFPWSFFLDCYTPLESSSEGLQSNRGVLQNCVSSLRKFIFPKSQVKKSAFSL